MEPTDFEYGERQYGAVDLAGHHWLFSEHADPHGARGVGRGVGRLVMDGVDPERLQTPCGSSPSSTTCPPTTLTRSRSGATGGLFKQVKERGRRSALDDQANDAAVTAATVTAAPGRIDDETSGLPLSTSATAARRARPALAGLLPVQAALPGRRRLLPPAVPRLRGA